MRSWLVGGLLAAAAIVGHLLLSQEVETYQGILLPLDHLYAVLIVLGLLAVGAAVGGRLSKTLGLTFDDPLEALLLWTAAGHAALATAVLGVGLFVSVRPPALGAVFAAAVAVSLAELRQIPSMARHAFREVWSRSDRFTLSLFVTIAAFLVIRALAPPTDWDDLMYHLRIPAQFLERGMIYPPEDTQHFGLTGLPHMLYLPLLALGSSAAPAVLIACYTIGVALAGFVCARRFLDDRTATVQLALIWGSTVLVLVGVTARTDTILAFYLFLVHYAALKAHQLGDRRLLLLAAALGGAAVGIKYNALLYLLALAPLVVWIIVTRFERRAAATLAMAGGAALVTALPWLLKNQILLGDMVYPFLNGRTPDPWLAALFPGDGWPAAVDRAVFAELGRTAEPFNLVDMFTAPERITVEAEGSLYRPLPLLLLPLWLLCARNATLARLGLPGLAYAILAVTIQPAPSAIRYLIPAIGPLTLVGLYSYGTTFDKLLSPRAVRVLLSGSTAIMLLLQTAPVVFAHSGNGAAVPHALGLVSRQMFVRAWLGNYADIAALANERLPRDSRILMLFDARTYYFRVPIRGDGAAVNWPILSARAVPPDCLRSTGVTHVLVNEGALGYYEQRGASLDALKWNVFPAFAASCLTPIYSAGGLALYTIRAPISEPK